MLHHRDAPLRLALTAACLLPTPVLWAQTPAPDEPLSLSTVQVIDTAPLPGLGTPLQDVPANVQVHDAQQLQAQSPTTLVDYLEQNANGVTLNAAQGNPWQPDVSFRGFTASPLLGLPQGLSVFQDGVRINEPFGDVVNWDLIPHSAIASLQLIPGSNPGFGLNTLGGALSIHTKSGLTHPGGSLQAYGGSFGRAVTEFEQGGRGESWHYYLTGNLARESGWAEHNPSQVQQFFGKVGYVRGDSTLDISLTQADTTLEGTQTLPLSMADNIRQAYTYPDINRNRLQAVNVKGSQVLSDSLFLDANVYARQYRNQNTSSNVNGDYNGTTVTTQAFNDRSTIDQDSYGLGLQFTQLGELAGRRNQLQAGASADLGTARYTQESQDASFTASRDTVGIGPYVLNTSASTDSQYYGVFFLDTLTLDERWALTLAGRYNLATLRIADRTGTSPDLNGEHTFTRFNPALGVNYNPSSTLTAYASYNEGMRPPTPIELTCANPAAPCKLPNNFLSDPPLQMVVARTLEFGLRGQHGQAYQWSAALYRTELSDDIQFISSQGTGTNTGYFQNVGSTLRQGLELAGSRQWGATRLSARYAYLDATYQSSFVATSPANSSADANGNIVVQPGNRIPGIPQHTLKLRVTHDVDAKWNIGLSALLSSAIYARGDENNQDANGMISGYGIVNLDTRYRVNSRVEVFGRVNNVFNRTYATFGTLGHNVFTGPGQSFDGLNPVSEQFLGYGAPLGAWVGLRYRWP
jgi:outer membrane receptor protein involved in Fe transport